MPAEVFPKRLFLSQRQFEGVRALLAAIRPANPFYTAKYEKAGAPGRISRLGDFFESFPLTTKDEIAADQRSEPPYGTNLTYEIERYTRCHQTSGTSGTPLRWLDTPESWNWMLANWERVYAATGVTRADRVFFAFSFGPFIGFWLGFEAAAKIGCLCLPGGGQNSVARLRGILDHRATVLCCTPTYAMHLASVAAREQIDLANSPIKTLLVAGEAGGSIPSVRARLEQLWPGARVADHHGMTEIGPVTHACPARPGVLHVIESAFLPEVIDPKTGRHLEPGATGELVLTNLGRTGSPLLRYRSGDLVKPALDTVCACGRSDLALEGGILGRTDDMVVVRGVNIYPGAVEEIVRATGNVAEYQVRINTTQSLPEMSLQIEGDPAGGDVEGLAHRLETALGNAFSLRVPVRVVAPGTLPRFELKAKRWMLET